MLEVFQPSPIVDRSAGDGELIFEILIFDRQNVMSDQKKIFNSFEFQSRLDGQRFWSGVPEAEGYWTNWKPQNWHTSILLPEMLLNDIFHDTRLINQFSTN